MLHLAERIDKIAAELQSCIYTQRKPIPDIQFKEGRFVTPREAQDDGSPWQAWQPGQRWGGRNVHGWFRFSVTVDETMAGQPVVVLVATGEEGWDAVNPQGLLFLNGQVWQGLDVHHREVLLSAAAEPGTTYQLDVQAYGGMVGPLTSFRAETAIIDKRVESFYYDLVVPLKAVSPLAADDIRRIDTLEILNDAINCLDLRNHGSQAFQASVDQAQRLVQERFYKEYCRPNAIKATSVGHTHIDVAWLWTLAQTQEKTARSFSTVLRLMEQYPEYIFMSSQAQLYAYLKADHPELYRQVQKRVAEGRWEVEGGMWVEADCNLASGESLVRQLLIGQRFFETEFGVKCRVLWLPDVFGYSAAMPQILKKAGIDYFMTTKLAWNQYNKIPYDTFQWRGLDGTEVLTHFITTRDYEKEPTGHFTTYNGDLTPKQVMGGWQRYQQKNINKDLLLAYGYGDGGGGTTREMLEEGRRMQHGIPACPQVQFGASRAYFERLEETVSDQTRLPKWTGELYLEYHRGTYTSMARNKRDNRRSELLYQDAEFLNSMAMLTGAGYPQAELHKHWQTILTHQFHDILPGTSIEPVYQESAQHYKEVLAAGETMAQGAQTALAAKIGVDQRSLLVWNTLSFIRSDYVTVELGDAVNQPGLRTADGTVFPGQWLDTPQGKQVLFWVPDIPAKGYRLYEIVECEWAEANSLTAAPELLENDYFRMELDDTGAFCSIWDKTEHRQVLPAGAKANVLQAFEDKPMRNNHGGTYDNWDIDIYYQEKMWIVDDVQSITVEEEGPLRACLRIQRKFSKSTMDQRIFIYKHLPRVDVQTTVNWQEDQVLLKAAFPVDVHTDKATFDIQFGHVERPTHWNTSWDWARFEVCAHKWMDLSETGYGVSVLNDSKYGCDVKENTMRLTLLKSGMFPYDKADREVHHFNYSLYPHAGDWKDAGVVQMGYQVNVPLRAQTLEPQTGTWPAEFSLLTADQANIIIETIKKAEDSEELIVRLYEAHNKRTQVTLQFGRPLAAVVECDLLEQDIEPVEIGENSCSLQVMPFEIKTLKVRLAND